MAEREAAYLLDAAPRGPAAMSEPNCQHSYLPGGLGCVVCETEAFYAYCERLRLEAERQEKQATIVSGTLTWKAP